MSTPAAGTPALPVHRRGGSSAPFAILTTVLWLFLFAASAPSPLYGLYAVQWRFGPLTLTAVFAVYALALLVALLLAGSLSDAIGRKPVVLIALLAQAVAMVLFIAADGLGWLFAARILQGAATGLVTAALAAGLIDLQPADRPGRGAVVNAVTPTFGLAAGSLVSGALVQYAPQPMRLIYVLLLVGFLGLTVAMDRVPETVAQRRRPAFRPRIELEPQARRPFLAAVPCLVATWALGGLYLSLGPSLVLTLSGSGNRLLGGSIVTVLAGTGGVCSLVVQKAKPRAVMIGGCAALALGALIAIAAVAATSVALLYVGSVIAGAGFGAAFLGAFRTLAVLASPGRRGGLVASVYLVSYLAFSVPAVIAGAAATASGLRATTVGYAIAVAALALASIPATITATRVDRA